jgi:thiol-disulfide isomerase/thioredoxin
MPGPNLKDVQSVNGEPRKAALYPFKQRRPQAHYLLDPEFDSIIKGLPASKACFVDFTATWCPPCAFRAIEDVSVELDG